MEYIVKRVNSSDELYHYGVKGMKWGVRKAASNIKDSIKKRRERKADRTIRSIEADRAIRKITYDYNMNEAKIQRSESSKHFSRIKDAMFDVKVSKLKKEYNDNEAVDKYRIAKAKAKKDSSYKRTDEYHELKCNANRVYGERFVNEVLLQSLTKLTAFA